MSDNKKSKKGGNKQQENNKPKQEETSSASASSPAPVQPASAAPPASSPSEKKASKDKVSPQSPAATTAPASQEAAEDKPAKKGKDKKKEKESQSADDKAATPAKEEDKPAKADDKPVKEDKKSAKKGKVDKAEDEASPAPAAPAEDKSAGKQKKGDKKKQASPSQAPAPVQAPSSPSATPAPAEDKSAGKQKKGDKKKEASPSQAPVQAPSSPSATPAPAEDKPAGKQKKGDKKKEASPSQAPVQAPSSPSATPAEDKPAGKQKKGDKKKEASSDATETKQEDAEPAQKGKKEKASKEQEQSGDGDEKDESKTEQKKGKKDDGKKNKKGDKSSGGDLKPLPDFAQYRIQKWEEIEKRRAAEQKDKTEISITLPDGNSVAAVAWETTPLDIARNISKRLAENSFVSKVDGKMWDVHRPLEFSCKLELCDFNTPEGKHAFWHSSAHVLGQALEQEFGCKLCVGPPLEDGGFYYDVEMGDNKISPEDFSRLEQYMNQLQQGKFPFKRLTLTKEEALDMFKDNQFKLEIIKNKVPDGQTCTAYRSGPLIDLCKGPHITDTGRIKAFSITKNSSAYWLGNADNASLQRVYGISFPESKMLKEWQTIQEEAAKRDHRRVGQAQDLFFFHELSPGSCFFLPHGARVYNKLIETIRTEYRKRGFQEVISPNVFNIDLWKTSGHYDNYRENMFLFEVEKQQFGMKPMNCPGHCLMFKHSLRSYRDLPLRLADFGVLHRNEFSGALTGLTRVRRFQQDDAHIFCRADQIEQEITGALDFLKYIYGRMGFQFELNLSTRPEKFLGEVETWNHAEKALADCLDKAGLEWKLNPGDGAFYGPKIDIKLTDALKRKHQCATIQLDFQLPIRFDLSYKSDNPEKPVERPVMIHRAILGSVERMFAVLIEHTGGKWPFWLSPRQAIVIPVAPELNDYATLVQNRIWNAGYYCDVDDSRDQFPKKVAMAQTSQYSYNYILVVGAKEKENGTVNIRLRGGEQRGEKTIDGILEEFAKNVEDFQ